MKRAAVYIRMSTEDQAGSPERQRAQVLPYCERKGYQVVEVYEDLGMRGWDADRPAFQRLLRDAQAKRFDAIVVDEQSRLCRNDTLDFVVTVAHPLRQAGVALEIVDQGQRLTWEDNDLAGLLMGVIGQHKASQESSTLGRRTATGMARKAKDGKLFVGRAPYGYQYVHDGEGNRVGYAPGDPEHVRVVRNIFDAYVNRDLSLDAIVAELNSLRVSSPKGASRWGKTTVHNILTNPVYAGRYVWGKVQQGRYYRSPKGEVVPTGRGANRSERRPRGDWVELPAGHEPLVAPALFEKAKDRLTANRIRTSPARKKGDYSLSQLLVCSHCGTPLYGTKRVSGGREETIYRCGSNMSNGGCAPRVVRESVIMDEVAAVLQGKFLDPDNLLRLAASLRRQAAQPQDAVKDLRQQLARLDKEIGEGKKKLPRIPEEYLDEYIAQIRAWERERADAQAELDRAVRRSPADGLERLTARVQKLVKCLRSARPEVVRPLLRETIDRVDLRFDAVKKAKVTRYPLAGGVVHLLESEDSSRSGPAAGR